MFDRLGRLLKSLRGGPSRLDVIERRLRSLDGIESRLHSFEARLQAGEAGTSPPLIHLDAATGVLRGRVRHLAAQLDLLKSSLEVDAQLFDDFTEWKAAHPIPDRPLVSVCVATFDRANTLLTRCIPSVLAQTYSELELIVVGDGCTDHTAEAIATVRDARVRFVNLAERGRYPLDARRRWMVAGTEPMNKALSLVRGDLVTHLDDDDEYIPDRLEKLVGLARDEGSDIVWHPFWYQDEQGAWKLNEASDFALNDVTTSSVLYRSWFTRLPWRIEAHRVGEPGDWNRFRRMLYLGPVLHRHPEPLLRHYRESRPD